MSELKNRLSETIKHCMKAGEKDRLTYARSLHAAIRKKEIDERKDVTDEDVMKIVQSLLKQRQDSISQFRDGGREDLVAKEEAELKFLQEYLPAQMGDDELRALVAAAASEAGATSAKDMGKVMKVLLPRIQGRADGKRVSELVKERLGG